MARIRSIKPEFPQSESMGRVSRDARLLFVQLWTICDDEGRGRGASKMLASLLFPYDDDAPNLIDGWLDELEREGCMQRYVADGTTLFQISNWRSHQKIDKPTPSRFPAPTGEISRRDSERDIEGMIFDAIKADGEIFGARLIDVQRQVRVGSSYLDIVAVTEAGTFVLEVKRDRLAQADIAQVLRYADLTGAVPVLVGHGISPLFPVAACREKGVAVLGIQDDGTARLLIDSERIKNCSITLARAIERHPQDKDQGVDQGSKDQGVDRDSVGGTSAPPAQSRCESSLPRSCTFRKWLESLKSVGELPIPEDDPIFAYAAEARIPDDYLRLAWQEFRTRYLDVDKRYVDWRKVFRRSVREDWFKLWRCDGEGYALTSKGQQAMTVFKSKGQK